MRDPHANSLAVWAAPFLAGVGGWVATQFLGFLAFLRAALSILVGAELGEFLARPYVFTGLCMVTAAVVTGAFKLAESILASTYRRERDEALVSVRLQAQEIAAFEQMTGRRGAEVVRRGR